MELNTLPAVLSLNPGRVRLVQIDQAFYVQKYTKRAEYDNLVSAKDWLSNSTDFLSLGDNYCVKVPDTFTWDEDTSSLYTSMCKGQTLESMVVTSKDRSPLVLLASEFLNWMRMTGFLWRGSAPRNIIIDHDAHEIHLVDFERPLVLEVSKPISDDYFLRFLLGTVHEEYCCFFTALEQEQLFPRIWERAKSGGSIVQLSGSRQRQLAHLLYDTKDEEISWDIFVATARMMSEAVTPCLDDNEIYYPAYDLEALEGGAEQYARIVISLFEADPLRRRETLRRLR